MPEIYWEDLAVGQVYELGSVRVDEDEMLEFAKRYDPQSFHLDPVAAREGPFGRVIASGWLTCALFMRLYVDGLVGRADSRGSPGIEAIRWLRPVHAGDVLSARLEIVGHRPSGTNPTRGTITFDASVRNQDDEVVMTLRAFGLYGRRQPAT